MDAYNRAKVRALHAMNKATRMLAGEHITDALRDKAVTSMREALHFANEAERNAKLRLDHLRSISRDEYDRTKVALPLLACQESC